MKLKFKHQKFQSDASKAIVDIFTGQPNFSPISYKMDLGNITELNSVQQKKA